MTDDADGADEADTADKRCDIYVDNYKILNGFSPLFRFVRLKKAKTIRLFLIYYKL